MKKRWIYLSAALLLLVGVCARKSVVSDAAPADPVNVSKECILTVNPVDAEDPAKESYREDMENTQITLELYKVAVAEKVSGYDTYRFDSVDAYAGLEIQEPGGKKLGISDYSDLQELTAADWKDLAQQAAKIALDKDSSEQPIASKDIKGVADATLSNEKEMKAGLYLLIARDTNPLEEGYVKTVKIKAEDGTTQEKLVTIANSDRYEYQFEPQLIALPTKNADANGVISTGNPGPWQYSQSIYLKSGREQRYAPLEIVKTLRTYETVEGTKEEPVTFVFRIVATLDGEEVYNNVTSLSFTEPREGRVTVDRIPATATVTVTEIYNGISYTQSVPSGNGPVVLDSISAEPGAPNTASFENVYNNNRTHGSGIRNEFVYENGVWVPNQVYPQQIDGQGGE